MYVYNSLRSFCSLVNLRMRFSPSSFMSVGLQLIVTTVLTSQIREVHDLDDHAGPAGKVLGALSSTSVRVVLLPGETCLAPRLVHGLHEVLAQFGVHGRRALLLRARLLGNILL